ncbi:FkbM family methyltransferase [Stutzerimonas kunmingensis]|uniref:FkbM family methyltransferase n=1 Tax=Stutzerimonas kunmingensis TaxID=1211807 RepID=UPI00241C2E9B|nr:FkbM family methyltransferase [Stutzerimonas kunmingensis]
MNAAGNERWGTVPLLIYGARAAGRSVLQYLRSVGVEVTAFLDRDATDLVSVDGVEVYTAEQWAERNNARDAKVLVGLFNAYVDQARLVEQLRSLGYGEILSLVDFVREFPERQPFRYWLVDPRVYESNELRLKRLRNALADEVSRELLDNIIAFRTGNGHWYLPSPSSCQYFPSDLPSWPGKLRLIDCGAYTGDTVQALISAGFEIEALATFEPSLDNYQVLVENLKGLNAVNFPCGVSGSNSRSSFDPSSGTGGHLVEFGGELVFCVRLDDALPGFAPNLIKMDVEGEELMALQGAETILRQSRPGLAIAVYHRAEHLWGVFEYIEELGLGYQFYLRTHACSTFETVLYAFPEV